MAAAAGLAVCALSARGADSTGYEELEPYAGDAHIHSALAVHWMLMDRPEYDPDVACVHSYELPATVYDRCRANGLDFCAISHHSSSIDHVEGVRWWTDADNPDRFGIGTDRRGFPLPEGGFATSELAWLQAVARGKTEPGQFVALYGIEYTVGSVLDDDCDWGAPQCGGHKIAVCPQSRESDTRCDHRVDGSQGCPTERDFYALVTAQDCVGIAAHPCSAIPTDFTAPTEEGGGFEPAAISGYEFLPVCEDGVTLYDRVAATFSRGRVDEDSAMSLAPFGTLEDPGGFVRRLRRATLGSGGALVDAENRWSYTHALQRGLRLGVTYGSDTHNRPLPAARGSGCQHQTDPPGTGSRMMCWASSLTADDILAALRERRCYYVREAAKPVVQFSLEGRPMGSILAVDEVTNGAPTLRVEYRGPGPSAHRVFDVVHNGLAVLRDEPCGNADGCLRERLVPVADPRGYWYLRLRDELGALVVTSPVWIE